MATPATRLQPPAHDIRPPAPRPNEEKPAQRLRRALGNLRAGALAAVTIVVGWGLARPRGERPR